MKKALTTLLLLTALLGTTSAQLKFGVKGGLDAVDMSFDKEVFDVSNRTGFFIGPSVKWTLPIVGVGFDISAFYDQKESKVNGENIKMKNILVPLNARIGLPLTPNVGFYLAAGPQFGFNIGDDEFSWRDRDDRENTFQLKNSNFSVNLGAGVYLTERVEIGFAYNIGMGKTADATVKSATTGTLDSVIDKDDTKPTAWTISAAFYF